MPTTERKPFVGFGAHLRGKPSHEALLSLQDSELRLLENMKRCMSLRVKCDRDYVFALNTLCTQAQKVEHKEFSGSMIAQSWGGMVEKTEQLCKLIKQNSDILASQTVGSLNNLIAEKYTLRKLYLDEHNRVHSELTRIQEAVNKTKSSYEKYLDMWRVTKAKYEEQASNGRNARKVDESKERFHKTTKKLHKLHNDYILLLHEGAQYEQHLRATLLPNLLDYHQSVLQESVEIWKNILIEYARLTDFTCDNFLIINTSISECVKSIIVEDEYKEFASKNRSYVTPVTQFIFDETLMKFYGGALKPNNLMVDSYTFESLKEKSRELQDQLLMCQSMLKEKTMDINSTEKEITSLSKISSANSMVSLKKRSIEIKKKEVKELKCKEQRILELCDLIKPALFSVGPNGPPPPIESPPIISLSSSFSTPHLGSNLNLKSSQLSLQPPSTASCSDSLTGAQEDGVSNSLFSTLQDEEWFHGVLPREEVVRLLVHEGDFLVRESIKNQTSQLVLSVCWKGHKHFIIQTTPEGLYRFEGPSFPSVQELVEFQKHSGMAVTNRSGAVIGKPVSRERWELNNDDVVLVEKIGRGNFGDVYRGILNTTGQEVAVKICQLNLPDEHKKRFHQEGRILKQYDHPNIVKLIGICVQKQPIMIVMELIPGGSLLNFLKNTGPHLTQHELLTLCIDAAAGMEYLESKNCIHRDLAARNCLVGYDNVVKISDFGMSREEEEYTVSDGMKQIPIKWTAPEALNYGKYTSLCDVWSYGVLMWEVFSLGGTPYAGLSNARSREMIDSGYRLPAPENTPPPVYELMLQCWEYEMERRPNFRSIHSSLKCMEASYRK